MARLLSRGVLPERQPGIGHVELPRAGDVEGSLWRKIEAVLGYRVIVSSTRDSTMIGPDGFFHR